MVVGILFVDFINKKSVFFFKKSNLSNKQKNYRSQRASNVFKLILGQSRVKCLENPMCWSFTLQENYSNLDGQEGSN